jgi:hypothetical protein
MDKLYFIDNSVRFILSSAWFFNTSNSDASWICDADDV